MEKCGDSRLQDAGDCFSRAGCWSTAAKAYAKGNYYSECLSVCSRGNLFDVGLRYIERWRECRTSNILGAGIVNCEEVEYSFLERCAAHYHELKDSKHMMKFVKAFNSISKARNFLKQRGYLDELLSMEVDLENFEEAANIAQLKGDHLLQADMLEKAGKIEASLRVILRYVIMNSLWTTGSNGWPLKAFKHREDLLKRAKVLAKKSPDCYFESIALEISILEDTAKGMADIVTIMVASRKVNDIGAQVFSSRKVIDFHIKSNPSNFNLETEIDDNPEKQVTKMLQNIISSETLVYVWNIWKETVCSLIGSLEKSDDLLEDGRSRPRDFCMNYFGVHINNDRSYVACNADSFWLRQSGLRSFKRDGKLALLERNKFVSASKSYWISELLSVGMDVLRCLEELSRFAIRTSFCSGCRGVALLRIFQLSKFLIDFQQADTKSNVKVLQSTLLETKRSFLDVVFPIDWRTELKKSAICLQEEALAKELLKDVLIDSITGRLTYGKIGRAAIIVMVTENLDEKLYETLITRLDEMRPWKIFVEHLRKKEPGSGLVASLQGALESTFQIDWQNQVDYISPTSFLYLTEQLLFMLSARGRYFFTTKLSFVHSLGWSDSCCCFNTDVHDQAFFMESFNCLGDLIQQILFEWLATAQWIKASGLIADQFYPILALKLVIMIGLVYLNSGQLLNILVEVFRRKAIVSMLPGSFRNLLRNPRGAEFHYIFATALKTIGDPLLIVSLTGEPVKFTCESALFIDMSITRSREDVMNVLFPKSEVHILESGSSSNAHTSSDYSVPGNKIASNLELSEEEIGARDDFQNLCLAFDSFLQEQSKTSNDIEFKIIIPNLKMEVDKFLTILDTQVKSLNQSDLNDDDKFLLLEIQLLVDELTQLSNLLNSSEDELEKSIQLFEELMGKLQKRRPRLQLYAELLMKEGVSTSGESSIPAASAKNGLEKKASSNKPKQQKKNKKKPKKGRK